MLWLYIPPFSDSVIVQSSQHFISSLLTQVMLLSNIKSSYEAGKEVVLKLKWAELTWSGLFWIEWKVVVVSVCIHFILTIVEPSFVFIFNLSNSKSNLTFGLRI